jgi:hypothetical protein
MKAIVVITESNALEEFQRACMSNPERGFTVIPEVWGRGKTGLKTGDRVHPGGSALLFTVVPDDELEATTAFLREVRDRAGVGASTKIYVAAIEEVG